MLFAPDFEHRTAVFLSTLILAIAGAGTARAERIELRESPADPRIYDVTASLDVAGKLQTDAGGGKAISLKLNVDAKCAYSERRLAGTGREAQALRAVRHYEKMKSEIQAGEQTSYYQLRPAVRLIVAHGQRDGMQLFSPAGPLTYAELDLLKMPADSLSALALLPDAPVEPGDTWNPSDWVLQFLTGLEAVEKSALTCKFESISGDVARVSFRGDITGATLGAAAELKVEGHFLYDIARKFVTRVELLHNVKQSVGTVSPGLDALAKVIVDRAVSENPPPITEKAQIPLEANPATLLLLFEAPEWNVRFYYPRQWHQFHQAQRFAVFRLLDRGNFVAQCDVHFVTTPGPGKRVSDEQFQMDIQRALGKSFQKIVQAERLKVPDDRSVYRVTVLGEAQQVPTQWIYYLVAHPDGRQVVFFFTVEAKLAEALQNRDLSIVGSLEFLAADKKPLQPAPEGK